MREELPGKQPGKSKKIPSMKINLENKFGVLADGKSWADVMEEIDDLERGDQLDDSDEFICLKDEDPIPSGTQVNRFGDQEGENRLE
ncbi:hypothetical protein XELAEV_18030610mg [Xenopus laevis]|uniref:Uncharacterized protein n=1 Tax=Xenopus laevis TaxID=8355 RepID=A0A974CL26_XENLA|nr:hypothetical protein XELAEV_18030610mg [Xenopus laevis]